MIADRWLERSTHHPEPTYSTQFVVLLVGAVLLIGALTFVPALALGPIVEHLQMTAISL